MLLIKCWGNLLVGNILGHLRKETNNLNWTFWSIYLTSGKGSYFWERLLTKIFTDNLSVGMIPGSLTFVCLGWPKTFSLVMIFLKLNMKHKLGCNFICQATLMSMIVRHCWSFECSSMRSSYFMKVLYSLGLWRGWEIIRTDYVP